MTNYQRLLMMDFLSWSGGHYPSECLPEEVAAYCDDNAVTAAQLTDGESAAVAADAAFRSALNLPGR